MLFRSPDALAVVGTNNEGAVRFGIAKQGAFVYGVDLVGSLHIWDVTTPTAPDHVGTAVSTAGSLFDVVIRGNYAYAVNNPSGIAVFDVSDETAPVFIGSVATGGAPMSLATHADVLYVGTGTATALFELTTDPEVPTPMVPATYNAVGLNDDIVFVDGARLYIGGNGGVEIADLTNPAAPAKIGTATTVGVREIARSGADLFVVTVNGLVRFDVTSEAAPVLIGKRATRGDPFAVAVGGGRVFTTSTGGLESHSLADLELPSVGALLSGGDVVDVAARGDLLLTAGGGTLRTIDARDPTDVAELDAQAAGLAVGVDERDGIAFVAQSGGGVGVYDVADPSTIAAFTPLATPADARAVSVSGDGLFVAVGTAGVATFDLSVTPTAPSVGPTLADDGDFVVGVHAQSGFMYAGGGFTGAQVWDVVPLASSAIVAEGVGSFTVGLHGHGDLVVAAGDFQGVHVIDASVPAAATSITVDMNGSAATVDLHGHVVFVGETQLGASVVDVEDPNDPVLVGRFGVSGTTLGAWFDGDRLYVAEGSVGLRVVDTAALSSTRLTAVSAEAPAPTYAIAWSGLFDAEVADVACTVTVGTCVVSAVDAVEHTATVTWNGRTPGDHSIAVAVGNPNHFLTWFDRVVFSSPVN